MENRVEETKVTMDFVEVIYKHTNIYMIIFIQIINTNNIQTKLNKGNINDILDIINYYITIETTKLIFI